MNRSVRAAGACASDVRQRIKRRCRAVGFIFTFHFMQYTEFKKIEELNSRHYQDFEVTEYLQRGWILIATRTVREVEEDGSFKDRLLYTLGHISENP